MNNLVAPNKSLFSYWWWTIDRFTFLAVLTIIGIGLVLVTTASPAVALRIGLSDFYFVERQVAYMAAALVVVFFVSMMPSHIIRRMALIGFLGGLFLLVFVLMFGTEIKGAKRWLSFGGASIQPSEFVKPFFIVTVAWILSLKRDNPPSKIFGIAIAVYILFAGLLVLQPDIGMALIVSAVFGGQLFLAGLPLVLIFVCLGLGVFGLVSAYNFFPHVEKRINSFLDPAEKSYQVRRSLEAFHNGGAFGKGPGEGVVKQNLPDSHTDFIFSVAGEEMGMVMCVVIVLLFAMVVLRSLTRVRQDEDMFVVYAVSGLAMQFGIQALINMGVTLDLFPTKGMTLPFISYGGSSLIAIALAVGMLLALTRKRYGKSMMR